MTLCYNGEARKATGAPRTMGKQAFNYSIRMCEIFNFKIIQKTAFKGIVVFLFIILILKICYFS